MPAYTLVCLLLASASTGTLFALMDVTGIETVDLSNNGSMGLESSFQDDMDDFPDEVSEVFDDGFSLMSEDLANSGEHTEN